MTTMPGPAVAAQLAATAAFVTCLAACAPAPGGNAQATTPPRPSTAPASRELALRPHAGPRALPRTLYGVTVDDVSNVSQIVASSRNLPKMPVTRIYFDVTQPVGYYKTAISELHPVSYLMGELLDSSDEPHISTAAFGERVRSFLATYGDQIDIWEIGNEVNGNWTGPYQEVAAKLITAYQDVTARHGRTALTLHYDAECGNGPAELDPITFTRKFVPRKVRNGLTYVFLSYYEGNCNSIRPSARTWTAYFKALHTLYPHARLGFGEIGMDAPVTSRTISIAKSMISYYYGLPIHLPYYAGGYFWWYYYEDCLPYTTKPLWQALRRGFEDAAASQR
jgi:hypothetical protein